MRHVVVVAHSLAITAMRSRPTLTQVFNAKVLSVSLSHTPTKVGSCSSVRPHYVRPVSYQTSESKGFFPNYFQPPQFQPFDFQGVFQYLQNLQAHTQNQAAANYPQGSFWSSPSIHAWNVAASRVAPDNWRSLKSGGKKTPTRSRSKANFWFGVPNNEVDNTLAERFGGGAGAGGFSGPGFGSMPSSFAFPNNMAGMGGNFPNFAGASAAAGISPQGGFQQANLFPDMGLDSRFGGNIGAPEGGTYGVFTSSSSGSSDVNGKRTSFKQATVGVNDNGKISFHTIKDPQ